MSTEVQTVLNAALALPLPQREELAAHLAKSLVDSPVLTPEEQAEVDSAWEGEIERRIAEYDQGRVKTIPGAQVTKELQEKFGL
jgi:putative addiction module component (TIGR02574 family)